MFLLRHAGRNYISQAEFDLHSNMFLLRLMATVEKKKKPIPFTFQYVSIKTH